MNNIRITLNRALPALVLCLTGLWLAGAAARADSPPPAQLALATVGETRVYTPKFMTLDCTQWQVTSLNDNGFATSKCGEYTAYNSNTTGAMIRVTDGSGQNVVQFTPFQPNLEFPLIIGKAWTGTYSGFLQFSNANWNSNVSCKVAGFETVQVPAGAMPSYRVECHEDWNSGPYTGSSDTTSWYAPQIHSVVKVDSPGNPKWNMQLVSFKP